MIIVQIFFTFVLIGLMTYGGGYSVIPLVNELIVKKYAWLTSEMVADIVSISEMSPGPFSLNCATFVGTKIAGLPGAIVATVGFILPSFIIILILAYYYNKFHELPLIRQVFTVLNACIIGILISSSIELLKSSVFMGNLFGGSIDIVALIIFIGSFLAIFKLKCNPVTIILASAILGTIIYPLVK